MARNRQPISWFFSSTFLPGTIVVLLITTIIFTALVSLWLFAFEHGEGEIYFDSYLQRVLLFTFIQAFFSSIISLILAVLLAKSLEQVSFVGKSFLIRIFSTTFALPSLVVVMGLLAIYGHQGLISRLCDYFNLDYTFSIYGLNGILLAHIFLNFPFATRICYQTLQLIPNEQKQLADQLGFNLWQFFRYIELPVLIKQLLPLGGLIFMLCFSSFATVLALSGGPKYTTIEVAIYQAIRDFELFQAVVLSFIQLFFCIGFMLLLKRLTPKHTPQLNINLYSYLIKRGYGQKIVAIIFILLSVLFIVTPLVVIAINGVYYFSTTFLTQSLWQSLLTSILVALCCATLAMTFAITLLWSNSRLQLIGKKAISEHLMLLGSLILAIPSMVLSAGFFLLFFSMVDVSGFIFILIVISNSFLALPFILKNLEVPLIDLTRRYHLLCLSLDVRGFTYFCLIEYRALKRLFIYSFGFASVMSMGDFGIIALFGHQGFMTLPYYLYELVSHYRYEEASLVALILLIISYLLINIFDLKNDGWIQK